MKSVATIAELRGYLSEQRRILVCFWKKGCPGCMAASKVIDLLHGPDCAVLGFDCTGGMKEAKALGVDNTPYWVLFERGEKSAEIRPTSDGEALHRFLTEKAGFALPEPILMAALEDGREYARNVQAAIAEILFRRADSDEDTLISAARLMILKACAGRMISRRAWTARSPIASSGLRRARRRGFGSKGGWPRTACGASGKS